MQGLYANDRFQLVVIFAQSDENWDVYGVENSEGWNGKIQKLHDDTYTMTANEREFKGSYDQYDQIGKIVWEDGDTWTRVDISSDQVYLITRKPYVPMTLALCVILRNCVIFLVSSVASFFKSSVRPRVHVL